MSILSIAQVVSSYFWSRRKGFNHIFLKSSSSGFLQTLCKFSTFCAEVEWSRIWARMLIKNSDVNENKKFDSWHVLEG